MQRRNPYGPCSASTRWVLIALLLTATTPDGTAQTGTDSTYTGLRPTFGLGVGMLGFYGDIGTDHGSFSPLVSRVGYELRATTPVTSWLEAGLYVLHGRVGVNERATAPNLNFESRITTGGIQFNYNFGQFLHPDHVVEPFISLGVESVEFLSKTDLYDAQGRTYHYWSDGSIRDISESAPNAGSAVEIQRDYTYESDIRELDLDGFGQYRESTLAIPVGIGAKMKLGGGFDFRIGTTMHFTMTDLIDGVTPESKDGRAGDGRNDRFLFTSFSMNYALDLERKQKVRKPTISSEEMDLIVLNEDEDGDGVPDMTDLCPHTPSGVPVSAEGCPLDGDVDGVPDHLDDELNSPAGAPVNARGVSLSDDDLLQAYLNYKDSANAMIIHGQVESIGGARRPPTVRRARTYVVKVGSQIEGISESEIEQILSMQDVRTIQRNDTTFYVVGNFQQLPEALRRKLELEDQGFPAEVMAEENGKLIDVPVGQRPSAPEEQVVEPTPPGAVVMRVQLGAFKSRVPEGTFADAPGLVVLQGEDGITRYYTGAFTDVNQAARHKVDMLLKGYDGAFLVAFKEGRRVSLREGGARLTGPEDLNSIPEGKLDKSTIRFRVQVGTFAGNVSTEAMDQYIEVGNVTAVPSDDAVRYFYGSYPTRAAAEVARKEVQNIGLEDAFVVGEVNGYIIQAEEAERLLSEP